MNNYRNKDFGRELSPFKRHLFVFLGMGSLLLGMAGIPLPLLPTTPFLLLSAWLFARSSKRFYLWLINHKYFGSYIRNYREKGGVTKKVKIVSVSMLWITIIASAIYAVTFWWVRIILFLIAIGVSIHILSLKTIR
jgi:uncharacterized protein